MSIINKKQQNFEWPKIDFLKYMKLQNFTLTLAALIICTASLLAQSKDTTAVYAIRNAKIVTVTGATIDKGTVVIRDGKIF